jgi:transcriptional regulator with XRE-family HTH domain
MEPSNFHIVQTRAATLAELGAHIRRARKHAGMRIDDAAALCGVSVGTLSRMESGKAAVTVDKVLRVLDRFGLAMLIVDKERLRTLFSETKQPAP